MSKAVLFILDHEFPPDVRVENEMDILNDKGLHVHLLAFTREGRPKKESLSPLLTVYRVPISKLTYKSSVACLKHPMYFKFWERAILEVAQEVKPNALHAHDLPLAEPVSRCAEKLSIPFILDLHENWPHMLDDAQHTNTLLGRLLSSPKKWRAYERKMTNKADAIITVVDEMKRRIVDLEVSDSKVFVYQNVPNIGKLDQDLSKTREEGFTLYYAGGVNYHRGLQVVIGAISRIKDKIKGFRFLIYGDGRYLNTLKEMVREEGLEEYVKFMGWRSQEEVMRGLSIADLAIVPHLRNVQNDHSSPNKIYQYMLSKTAVISSNCASLERVVHESGAGLVYRHDSPEDLASKLVWASQNKSELEDFGEKGRAGVLSRYNTDRERQGIEDTYQSIGLL